MVDLHCHILPGIDDGAPDMETSLEMAQIAVADGIDTVVATPHASSTNPLSPSEIRAATQAFNEALRQQQIDLVVLPGAEVEAQLQMVELLRGKQLITIGDRGRHLLIETPFVGIPQFLEQICFELQIAGITPVLAHPERSELARQQPEVLQKLAERGCLLQVNADSVLGRAGRDAKRLAVSLLRTGQAQILASDAHDAHYRPPRLSSARNKLERAVKDINFQMLTDRVPRSIIDSPKESHK